MTDLSIIIINWNSAQHLHECLRSIYSVARSKDLEFEVIVVDNASFDGSESMVRQNFPAVRFIQSHYNLGFARANNLAFASSRGRNLLFLNPDTEIHGRALETICAVLDSTADAGIVGCTLLNSDLSVQTSCIQAFPSAWNQILDSEFLRGVFPSSSLWGTRALQQAGDRLAAVDMVSGACLMIRRSVFEEVGQFSTEYFMYAEDTDLCWNVAQAGWRNYLVKDARVIHHGGQSSGLRPSRFATVMMQESKCKFMRLRYGRAQSLGYRAAMIAAAVARLSILAARLPLATSVPQRTGVRSSMSKWLSILRWSLGFERRALARWASTSGLPASSPTPEAPALTSARP